MTHSQEKSAAKLLVKLIILPTALIVAGGLGFSSHTQTASAGNPCPIGKQGHQLTRLADGSCADLAPPSPETQEIGAAKDRLARTYADLKAGNATQADVDEEWDRVKALTGGTPFPSSRSLHGAGPNGYVGLTSHQQINSNYCGPATAQNMLWYLGPLTSVDYDPETGGYDTLNGNGSHDQPILANYYWLATDRYLQTYWGDNYMPFTLNHWKGGSYYLGAGTPNVGGSLDKGTAAYYLQLDTNYGWPDAENILYNSASYYPPGFATGTSYEHWDTVYYFDGSTIGIAQSFTNTGNWTPYYSVSWYYGWLANGNWHGIVW